MCLVPFINQDYGASDNRETPEQVRKFGVHSNENSSWRDIQHSKVRVFKHPTCRHLGSGF